MIRILLLSLYIFSNIQAFPENWEKALSVELVEISKLRKIDSTKFSSRIQTKMDLGDKQFKLIPQEANKNDNLEIYFEEKPSDKHY